MSEKTTVDMHNRISAAELQNILRMQLRALDNDPEIASTLPPLMIWGPPGVGKSSIVRAVAEEFGINFVDFRLAQHEPVDIRGLPVPDSDRKCVDWFVSGEWPREGRGIILFDELTSADKSLQVAAYELILDRRLGDTYKVPEGWYICGAGNRVEDSAVAMTMSSALANRFMHVEITEDIDAFCSWAVKNGIHPAVTGFLRYRPECLLRQTNENLERGWPSPRSWERVSCMINVAGDIEQNGPVLRKMIYGLVGNRAGLEFFEYFRINAAFDDVKSMMLDKEKEIVIPAKIDRKYALCAAVSYFVWRGNGEREQKELLDGFYRIGEKLSSDFATMVMVDSMTGCGCISAEEAASKLFHHPAYKKWSGLHGKAMKKHLKF